MHFSLGVVTGFVASAVWAWLLIFRGAFWRVSAALQVAAQRCSGNAPRIVAVVPARDEAEVIGRTVRSLLTQSIGDFRVVVVDDHSTDRTAERAREAAEAIGKSHLLDVLQAQPLTAGWTGKLWAVRQGIERAREFDPEYLLLTDADIAHSTCSVAELVQMAESAGYDLTSYMAKLECSTLAEKFLIPAFIFFFFKLYPPKWVRDSRSRTAAAAGGCMLVRSEALRRAGGIDAIRHEIIDDCALARAIKKTGGRVWLGLTNHVHSFRPYAGVRGIGRMISRSAFNQLRHSTLLLIGTVIAMSIAYVAPVVLVLGGRGLTQLAGALAFVMMIFAYLPMVRFYGLNPLWALTLPGAALFYMGATFHSAFKFWAGTGGQWKGRAQDLAPHSTVSSN